MKRFIHTPVVGKAQELFAALTDPLRRGKQNERNGKPEAVPVKPASGGVAIMYGFWELDPNASPTLQA
jgi:hypothetical protein